MDKVFRSDTNDTQFVSMRSFILSSLTKEPFDESSSEPVKSYDVNDGLDGAVDQGEGVGDVHQFGLLWSLKSSCQVCQAVGGDAGQEKACYEDHLQSGPLQHAGESNRLMKSEVD